MKDQSPFLCRGIGAKLSVSSAFQLAHLAMIKCSDGQPSANVFRMAPQRRPVTRDETHRLKHQNSNQEKDRPEINGQTLSEAANLLTKAAGFYSERVEAALALGGRESDDNPAIEVRTELQSNATGELHFLFLRVFVVGAS